MKVKKGVVIGVQKIDEFDQAVRRQKEFMKNDIQQSTWQALYHCTPQCVINDNVIFSQKVWPLYSLYK